MTPQELKASILQLAIQGKLVEQRPEEGTGAELLEKILAAKGAKGGACRRASKLAGKEGMVAEATGTTRTTETTGTTRTTETSGTSIRPGCPVRLGCPVPPADAPFDIPESWVWARLGEGINLLSGRDLEPSEYSSVPQRYPYMTGASNFADGHLIVNRWTERAVTVSHKGELLITCKGTIGAMAFNDVGDIHIARQIMAISSDCIDLNYVKVILEAMLAKLQSAANSMIPGISRQVLLNLVIPLPPLAEQKRIVAKIEELLPYIDRYEKAWSKLEDFNKRFPGDMQKSLLQMAIQGKLVDQRPEEGTGAELLEKILAAKGEVNGKRGNGNGKSSRAEARRRGAKAASAASSSPGSPVRPGCPVPPTDVPFDIPESWKWVRLNTIAQSIVDCPHSTPKYLNAETLYCAIDTNCINEKGDIVKWRYVDSATYQARIARLVPQKEDIVYTREGSICRAAILPVGKNICLGQRVMLVRCSKGVCPQFLRRMLMTPMVINTLTEQQKGIGAKHVNVSDVCSLTLPLPPLAEQKRIVAKLEELLPLCERLK